jgi:hypothetical protein
VVSLTDPYGRILGFLVRGMLFRGKTCLIQKKVSFLRKVSSSYRLKKERRYLLLLSVSSERLCGVVVRVPGDRSRVLCSIFGFTRFSEKFCRF